MIKKMWVKFDGMSVECICDDHCKKRNEDDCNEYVVKFTKVEQTPGNVAGELSKEIGKLNSELKKSINKFKI